MLPFYLARTLATTTSPQQIAIIQSFSLLFLGATLSTLATLNFSLALVVGLLCAPLSFIRPLPSLPSKSSLKTADDAHTYFRVLAVSIPATAFVLALSPMTVLYGINGNLINGVNDLEWLLLEMAKAWSAQGVWTSLVVWGIWWPAWLIGGSALLSGVMRVDS